MATHRAHTEESDQTGRMPRLIWVFAERTGHFVGFVMLRLKYLFYLSYQNWILMYVYDIAMNQHMQLRYGISSWLFFKTAFVYFFPLIVMLTYFTPKLVDINLIFIPRN